MASEPSDDRTIVNVAVLWRRIHPRWIVSSEDEGGRVSSAAFDNSPDGSPTSVLLADIVAQTGRSAIQILAEFPGYALASLAAGQARSCRQGIARDPLSEESAHAIVFGAKTRANKRCLAKSAVWVVPIASER